MEADWSVEIGPDFPSIEASWHGFVDLRASPQSIKAIDEATKHRALRDALMALSADNSPAFTTKCDTWKVSADEIDPYEFGASPADAQTGFASYIDILERDPKHFQVFAFHENRARDLIRALRAIAQPQCRVDLVLRAATLNGRRGFGFTLYVAACGSTDADAYAAWQAVLAVAVAATIAPAHPDAGE